MNHGVWAVPSSLAVFGRPTQAATRRGGPCHDFLFGFGVRRIARNVAVNAACCALGSHSEGPLS